jgi:hypothetical protein
MAVSDSQPEAVPGALQSESVPQIHFNPSLQLSLCTGAVMPAPTRIGGPEWAGAGLQTQQP